MCLYRRSNTITTRNCLLKGPGRSAQGTCSVVCAPNSDFRPEAHDGGKILTLGFEPLVLLQLHLKSRRLSAERPLPEGRVHSNCLLHLPSPERSWAPGSPGKGPRGERHPAGCRLGALTVGLALGSAITDQSQSLSTLRTTWGPLSRAVM